MAIQSWPPTNESSKSVLVSVCIMTTKNYFLGVEHIITRVIHVAIQLTWFSEPTCTFQQVSCEISICYIDRSWWLCL